MSPFDLLGLTDDADERAIKRAYAQRLRGTRPEDDAPGFQRLHAAYQAALEYCREAPRSPIEPPALLPDEASVVPATTTSAIAVEPIVLPPFDPAAFCSEAFERAAADEAAALQLWLAEQPALWSLQLKMQTSHYLMEQLYLHEPPMSAACMEALLRFFDLDHALAGHDPLALVQLERRTRLAWQLQSSAEAVLASRLEIQTSSQRWRAHWILSQLQRPFEWPRVLWLGLYPANPGMIADFVENVSDHHPEDLPATIDRTQLTFWRAAARRQPISRPRLFLGIFRSAIILLLAMLLAPLLSYAFTDSIALQPMLIAVGVLMIPCAAWALWIGWSALDHWHIEGGSLPADRSARTYLVPAMCVGGIMLDALFEGGVGLLLFVPSLWLAMRRYWYQHPSRLAIFRPGNVRLMLVLSIFLLRGVLQTKLGDDAVSLGEIIAAVAMLAWAADLWKQRKHQVAID
ncbi:J domain-containing protein [Rhodanobacter sp. AS-Z3]|uniref:J domain-containing protein n=1 Tax=Rhodanobacter sp. AS-Z3 TaxID=3031330 RepID=UPI002478FC07|nr:J domain-containing protein [Rhodanobacter sp. AS-Z3]WEN14314.1 J domain-containing protein [Rhodanobacter sp. AS-Z3]